MTVESARAAGVGLSRPVRHVLLIGLPVVLRKNQEDIGGENALHLGLAYLAAVLRDHGIASTILDCYAEAMEVERPGRNDGFAELGLDNEGILARVREAQPDLIGISIPFSCQHEVAHDVARAIKVAFPVIPIVAGGNHVTALPERIGRDCFDHLIVGEGEFPFLALIQAIGRGEPAEGISGVYGSNAGHPGFIPQLDDLPLPALDLMPMSRLWKRRRGPGGVRSRRRWVNVIATRGCVFDCNFCSIHTIMGYPIRRRSVENVLAEIIHWKRIYNIQDVYFEDDNMTAHKRWAKDLFRQIANLRLDLRLFARNGVRADTLDREMLTLMKAAGFHDFMIAPESGSQNTLDQIIGKRMKLTDCENAIRLAAEIGLGVNVFFILGFPEETWADLEQTVRYARYLKRLGAVGVYMSTATPYPGTRLYAQCVEQGLIDPNIDFRRLRTADYVIKHPVFAADELRAFRRNAMRQLEPHRLTVTRVRRAVSLIRKDPSFFYTKLRYHLNH